MDDVVHLEGKSMDVVSGVVEGNVCLPTRPLLHKRLVSRATIGHATVLDQWTDAIPRLRTRSVCRSAQRKGRGSGDHDVSVR